MHRNPVKFISFLIILTVTVYCPESIKSDRIYPDYTWKADLLHSSISFRTMHWGIIEIVGWFEDFDVTLKKDGDNWECSEINIVIYPKSVRLPNMGMAGNLQGEAFFDSENYLEMLFESKKIEQKSDSVYVVTGDMTIKETTRSIDWNIKFNGDAIGTPGFTATGSFTLEEFNMNMAKNELGNKFFDVGDTVYVRCNFRLDAEW